MGSTYIDEFRELLVLFIFGNIPGSTEIDLGFFSLSWGYLDGDGDPNVC
jgi:hypothetical protein